MKYCFEHKQEVRKGKRACEYRLIWERDVAGLSECDMADAVIVRADEWTTSDTIAGLSVFGFAALVWAKKWGER